MSPTIRVNERTKNAIESFQDEDQSMSEAIEEIVEELGLFGERRLTNFQDQLSTDYGLNEEDTEEVLRALRTVYTKREAQGMDAGVPVETVTGLESQLGILTRLGLIETQSTERSSGYFLTDSGETIASAAMDQYLSEQTSQLCLLSEDFHPRLVAFFLEFGFNTTDSGHLSTSVNVLDNQDWITDPEIDDQYSEFLTRILEDGFAVRNEWRENDHDTETPIVVLPPEFKHHLAAVSDQQESALIEMEVYHVVNEVIEDSANIKTRDWMLRTLTIADESHLRTHINRLWDQELTSKYSQNETPFLVTDITEFRNHIQSQVMEVVDE